MKLEHRFTVPAPVPDVWAALLDPEKVAPCMPGATLTGVDGRKFTGTVKVKLGPVTLLYKGTGEFTSVDERVRAAVLKASGKDTRGNGTASASVSVALTSAADGTEVSVVTDLSITGRPAQLGRGLISEVSGRLIAEFAECLATRLAPAEAERVTPTETAARPHLRAVPDEPIDLVGAAGVPVLKRVLPVAAGLLAVVLLVRKIRGRHR
ncbi:SRPBCC family protein [Actinosynnema sp. NPDC091369]